MKITFSGTPEEIAAAIRTVAGVGEVKIRVPTEQRIKREDVRLELLDIVHHRDGKILPIYADNGDCGLPLETDYWFVGRNGTCGNPLGTVTHFRRNGITYAIED